jgi:hypothetical protein
MSYAYLTGVRGPHAMLSANIDANVTRVAVEVAVPAGPFIEVERMAPGDAAPRRATGAPDDVPWRIYAVEESKRGVNVVLVDTHVADEKLTGRSWLLQVVCHDGRVVLPGGFQSSVETGMEASFNVPLKDVAYVIYRCRPYAWRPLGELEIPPSEWVVTTKNPDQEVEVKSVAEAARLYRAYRIAATQATQPAGPSSPGFGIRSKQSTTRPNGLSEPRARMPRL